MLVDIVLGDEHIQMSKSRTSSDEANNYSIHQKLTECLVCTIYYIMCQGKKSGILGSKIIFPKHNLSP